MQEKNRFRRYLRPLLFVFLTTVLLVALTLSLVWCGALQADNRSLRQQLQTPAQVTPTEQSTPTPIQSEQRSVTLQSTRGENIVDIYATVTLPPLNMRTTDMPFVILCHGFTGNREGDGHFVPLALRLAEQGVAAIALDFAGCGDSTEESTAYTLETIQADILAASDYMRVHCGASGAFGLLGHSMGGRVVSLMLDDTVAAAALWSPANNAGLDGLEFLSHDGQERERMVTDARESGSLELPSWNTAVSYDFLAQMEQSDPWHQLNSYQGSLLVTFAAGDTDLLSQNTIDGTLQAAADRNANYIYSFFADATHNYTALDGNPQTDRAVRDRLESLTANFFVESLL